MKFDITDIVFPLMLGTALSISVVTASEHLSNLVVILLIATLWRYSK